MEIKESLETARNQLGPDWLQYLVHNKASSNQKRLDLVEAAVVANQINPKETEDDLYLNAEDSHVNTDLQDVKVVCVPLPFSIS